MVSPHPELMRKIRNTKKLVKEKREHLIPGLVQKFPDQYLALDNFTVFETLKPWVELPKPKPERVKEMESGLRTLQPVHDRILVLCVDFTDKPAQISTGDIYDRFFSTTGKSLRKYFDENSYGKYVPDGEVHGWYTAPQPYNYYINEDNGLGSYPNNAQKLVEDVLNIAVTDPAVVLPYFDVDEDNVVDHLMIVHAGAEGAYTGITNDFWAHAWAITPTIKMGYGFQYYAMVSEFMSSAGDVQRTGIDCHEYGHNLGLPDLYDYSGNSNGVGMFSLMASGSWGENAITPTHLDAWSKYFCEFSNTLVNPSDMVLVTAFSETNYLFTTQYSNEYFMIENRQNLGFDAYLPANGILVWKVNAAQQLNDNELCYKVGLVQADGLRHLENSVNSGDPGDSYPGTTVNRAVSMTTTPSTVLCAGTYPSFSIRNITDSAITMSFVVELCPPPVVNLQIV